MSGRADPDDLVLATVLALGVPLEDKRYPAGSGGSLERYPGLTPVAFLCSSGLVGCPNLLKACTQRTLTTGT